MMCSTSALLRQVFAAAMLFASMVLLSSCVQAARTTQGPKVIVISLDAFGAASLHEPQLPAPTLYALMKRGVYAVSIQSWPIPTQSDQAPDLLLYAAVDYKFIEGDTGEFVTQTPQVGAHGYPNSDPLMQGIFIAAGFGIQRRGEIPAFPNVDIAPTIAHLLHVSLGTVQGKPLTEVLEPHSRVVD